MSNSFLSFCADHLLIHLTPTPWRCSDRKFFPRCSHRRTPRASRTLCKQNTTTDWYDQLTWNERLINNEGSLLAYAGTETGNATLAAIVSNIWSATQEYDQLEYVIMECEVIGWLQGGLNICNLPSIILFSKAKWLSREWARYYYVLLAMKWQSLECWRQR